MVTEQTIQIAKDTAEALRQRGEPERAQAIEELVQAVHEETPPALDLLTSTQVGEPCGVTGRTIKNWVREGRLSGYTVGGRLMIPREVVAEYVRRSRGSLDLEDFSDEEAARLVAEGRTKT